MCWQVGVEAAAAMQKQDVHTNPLEKATNQNYRKLQVKYKQQVKTVKASILNMLLHDVHSVPFKKTVSSTYNCVQFVE